MKWLIIVIEVGIIYHRCVNGFSYWPLLFWSNSNANDSDSKIKVLQDLRLCPKSNFKYISSRLLRSYRIFNDDREIDD